MLCSRVQQLPAAKVPRELLERLQEVGLVEVVVLNQWSVVTVGGSPYPLVHGVKPQDVRQIFWSHARVFQEPAFEMSPGPAHFARQRFDADPTFVLFQTTNGVLERQISSIVSP